ncbi:large ribosomal subunit protein eL14 isoform X1 [Elaeis guineensis]|uniref:large ribosomal subunit protein eL14 isoform X1 n=1 Tax=Elaeis guineensis var. tenera TaxID=51953 RepID=UPI00057A6EBC
MPFKRYVEIGRVALVNYGKDYGRLVVIVDVIDQNRALVDAPDMVRGQMNFKRLSLTDIKIDIPRLPKKKSLIAAMEAADVKNKWENSSWGRKLIVQKRRASLNDFDRFKVMLARIKVRYRGEVLSSKSLLNLRSKMRLELLIDAIFPSLVGLRQSFFFCCH